MHQALFYFYINLLLQVPDFKGNQPPNKFSHGSPVHLTCTVQPARTEYQFTAGYIKLCRNRCLIHLTATETCGSGVSLLTKFCYDYVCNTVLIITHYWTNALNKIGCTMATIPNTTSSPKSTSLRQYIYGSRHHVSSKGSDGTHLSGCMFPQTLNNNP